MGQPAARATKPQPVPPLRDGDRMGAAEFWRRYEASPHVRRAELIRGVVHIISEQPTDGREPQVPPISHGRHADPHSDVINWLGHYAALTPGTRSAAPGSVRTPTDDSTPEPDASLRVLAEFGGQTRMDEIGYLHGSPELIVEVAGATAAHDLGDKFDVYPAAGVREYAVWRTRYRVIDWFRLNRAGRFVAIPADEGRIVRSQFFPGLWLDTTALIAGDMRAVFAVIQQGVDSPGHAAFVEKLRRRAARRRP